MKRKLAKLAKEVAEEILDEWWARVETLRRNEYKRFLDDFFEELDTPNPTQRRLH